MKAGPCFSSVSSTTLWSNTDAWTNLLNKSDLLSRLWWLSRLRKKLPRVTFGDGQTHHFRVSSSSIGSDSTCFLISYTCVLDRDGNRRGGGCKMLTSSLTQGMIWRVHVRERRKINWKMYKDFKEDDSISMMKLHWRRGEQGGGVKLRYLWQF